MAENGIIGRDGRLPWHLRSDLRRFRSLTTGHAIVMGRRTWESIGRPLPDRVSIVLTHSRTPIEGAITAGSLADALTAAATEGLAADIIGGAVVYREALGVADVVELTRVHAEPAGDTWFPGLDRTWQLVAREPHRPGPGDDHPFTFETWARARG